MPCRHNFGVDVNADIVRTHMQRLSPPEPIYALFYAMEAAINNGVDDAILLKWKKLILSAGVANESVFPGEARSWRAQNLRQELIDLGDVSKLTVREQILDVAGFKQEKERELGRALSNAAASSIWMDKVKFERSSDKVSATWVETAITGVQPCPVGTCRNEDH